MRTIKRAALAWCMGLVAIAACGDDPASMDGGAGGLGGAAGSASGGAGGSASGGTGGSTSGGAGGMVLAGAGGMGAGMIATGGMTGMTGGAGGAGGMLGGGAGGASGGAGGMDLPPGVDPMIPTPSGECPDLTSGTHMINGLSVEILAGTPGATKGPLLFTWHGTNGTSAGALRQLPDSVKNDITAQGGIVIAPQSTMQPRDGADVTFILGVWYDGADLAMADLIVGCAVQNNNIDPRRIYVTGCSAGGLMTGVMSIMRASYVAASAPNSGGLALPGYMFDDDTNVPAVFAMHGGANDNVVINFGDSTHTLGDTMKPAGSFFVECNHMIGHCQAPVELHEKAWEFMKAHPYGVTPKPYEAGGLPADYPEYCMVY
jgi:hypothetical protein